MAMTRRSTRSYGPNQKGFSGLGALNCPGDPGCPGYVDPAVNQAILNAIAQQGFPTDYSTAGPGAYAQPYGPPAAPGWLAAAQRYATAIYAGAALLIILALAGGRR